MKISRALFEAMVIILALPFLFVISVVVLITYLVAAVFGKITEHFANAIFCPYQPDDLFSPVCDKKTVGTDECERCSWRSSL